MVNVMILTVIMLMVMMTIILFRNDDRSTVGI